MGTRERHRALPQWVFSQSQRQFPHYHRRQQLTFTLCDCEPDGQKGTVTHMPNSSELSPNHSNGVVVAGGIFEMYSGTISGNTVEKNGGGVWVKHTGTFSVSSVPIIKDNKMG